LMTRGAGAKDVWLYESIITLESTCSASDFNPELRCAPQE